MLIRPPAVAGQFYPAGANDLHDMIKGFLDAVPDPGPAPKALIAPHAGYIYSGPVAASVYARVKTARDRIQRVVLLGPAHRVPFQGLATSGADAFRTPLGDVMLDRQAIEAVQALPQVRTLDQAHAPEHSLEVHLPFLQEVLDDFTLVPLVVGDATAEQVAEALEILWGGDETLIVISSDLSHYHDYDTARQMDEATSRAIEEGRIEAIGYDQACGRNPVAGMLLAARRHQLRARTLDLRNSGDTAGPRNQVVGYGAYVFEPLDA